MGIISWIILGLIAGAIARWLVPGPAPTGFFKTALLGIAGAFVGGFAGSFIGLGGVRGLGLGSILIAAAGAALLLFAYGFLEARDR